MRRRIPWKYVPLVVLWAALLWLAAYLHQWGEIVAVFVGLALGVLIVAYQRPRVEDPFFVVDPTELDIGFGTPRRQSRVTVAFRGLLVLPHRVVLVLLTVVSIPLLIMGWFAALILGRLPRWIATYEIGVIGYGIRVNAYAFMLAGEFPPFGFDQGRFPISVELGASVHSRLTIFFRWLLVIPAGIAAGLSSSGLLLFSPILWLVTLILGRMPQPLFSAASAVVRFQARVNAYSNLVTESYPGGLFGDEEEWRSASQGSDRERRLSLSRGAKRLVVLWLGLGPALLITGIVVRIETRPQRNPVVVAAEVQLEKAAVTAVTGVRCDLHCMKLHEHAFGEAYFRFARTISGVSFPRSQSHSVSVVIHDAWEMGLLLLAASKSKDGGRSLGIDPSDPGDSPLPAAFDEEMTSVLGPSPY